MAKKERKKMREGRGRYDLGLAVGEEGRGRGIMNREARIKEEKEKGQREWLMRKSL